MNYLNELGSDEEFGFTMSPGPCKDEDEKETEATVIRTEAGAGEEHVLENGEVEDLEESGSEDNDELMVPPPIPPRNHSLSPGPTPRSSINSITSSSGSSNTRIAGRGSMHSDDRKHSSGLPFLLEGRGGEEREAPPLLQNGIASSDDDENLVLLSSTSPSPPPLPAKQKVFSPSSGGEESGGGSLQSIEEEEKKLLGELDILGKMVGSSVDTAAAAAAAVDKKTSEEQTEVKTPVVESSVDSKALVEIIENAWQTC